MFEPYGNCRRDVKMIAETDWYQRQVRWGNIANRAVYAFDLNDNKHRSKDIVYEKNDPVITYLKKNGCRSFNICLEAAKRDGLSLNYIMTHAKLSSIHLEKVQLAAIKNNDKAFTYVKNPTFPFCSKAVNENGLVLQYIKNKTNTLCLAAVKQNGLAINFVPNKTPLLCIAALKQNRGAAAYIDKKMTDKIREVESVRNMTIGLYFLDLPTDILVDISKYIVSTNVLTEADTVKFIDQIKNSCCRKIEK